MTASILPFSVKSQTVFLSMYVSNADNDKLVSKKQDKAYARWDPDLSLLFTSIKKTIKHMRFI